jgi:hypothetical protein
MVAVGSKVLNEQYFSKDSWAAFSGFIFLFPSK